MKYAKSISWFLGVSMFMFGLLKFFNPFKEWYQVQITNSGLGRLSYAMGIMGEIVVGATFIFCIVYSQKVSAKIFPFVVGAASIVVVVMMATGIFVHLHPDVPAEVLPLNIKPPFIPGFFMVLAIINLHLVTRRFFVDFNR